MFKVRFLFTVVLFLAQGIFEILRSFQNVSDLEERLQRLIQQAGSRIFSEALVHIDKELSSTRDPALKSVGLRKRTLVTSFGEITIKRRLYRDRETGECHFLLDETLGLPERKRTTPRMKQLMLELGTEMPYRRAARILELLVPGVHWMTVWAEVRAAGKQAERDVEEQREALFENGVAPRGSAEIEELFIEGDGVIVPLQRTTKRHGEIKLMVGYEGKDRTSHRLVNPHTVATTKSGPQAWETASAAFENKWAMRKVKRVRIGGDGAEWVKRGLDIFPGATYHLDPFHIRQRMTEALGYSSEVYAAVSQGLAELNQQAVLTVLDRAIRFNRGARRKRIGQLKRYLLSNWDGIAALPEDQRLGAIEGQVRHTIARRMKRIGARWSPNGAEQMACLLAGRANNDLERYAKSTPMPKIETLKKAAGAEAINIPERFGIDPEGWLKTNCPALAGPHTGRHWVKALREIGSQRWSLT